MTYSFERIRFPENTYIDPDKQYYISREGAMKHHSGFYRYVDLFNDGDYYFYNEDRKVYYFYPFNFKDMKLYLVTTSKSVIGGYNNV